MTLFSWVWYVLYRFWVLMIVWLTYFSWIIFLFYSLLEGFRTSLQVFHKTSCVILHLVEFSIMLKIIFKSYFWKPLPSKGGWMGDHALFAQIENHFKLVHDRVVSMSYTLDPHCVFNWYHNWYLFCILIFVSIHLCFNFK